MFLAVGLKLPLIGLFYVIWKAAKLGDQAHAERGSAPVSRMALCGYCGTRITIGYDAGRVHQRAAGIAARTGQAAFDVETRLVREELALPDRYPVERYFRDARMLTFPDGTSEVHQLLIGRSATGLDAFRG